MTLIAYHGQQATKDAILAQLQAHRIADQLVQGYGYWRDGKGCAVGCTLHSGDYAEYETRFGIPIAIARLEDSIFEGLPVVLARAWPERLMSAIRPGADLSRVHWHLLHWLLTTPSVNPGVEHHLVRDAVRQCADLMADLAAGKQIAAASAAESAASARSAAWSARSAAELAASARSAAWSAESAASAAAAAMWAESARSAARSAAAAAMWAAESAESAAAATVSISDRLIELIETAPIHQEEAR